MVCGGRGSFKWLKYMKTMRIVNSRNERVYVERLFFRRWWVRISPSWVTNIEAWNWVRGKRNVNLVKRK